MCCYAYAVMHQAAQVVTYCKGEWLLAHTHETTDTKHMQALAHIQAHSQHGQMPSLNKVASIRLPLFGTYFTTGAHSMLHMEQL